MTGHGSAPASSNWWKSPGHSRHRNWRQLASSRQWASRQVANASRTPVVCSMWGAPELRQTTVGGYLCFVGGCVMIVVMPAADFLCGPCGGTMMILMPMQRRWFPRAGGTTRCDKTAPAKRSVSAQCPSVCSMVACVGVCSL